MRPIIVLTISALSATSAFADDRSLITTQMQEMADALVPGDAAVWEKNLDANVIYAEEDDTYKGKADALKELKPLPKGLSGTIRVELLSYFEEGGVAVALFRQNETEHYFGQTIHAAYLTNTTWKGRA